MTKLARIGRFVDEDARTEFLAAYDEVMTAWPEHKASDVDTRFGTTRVYRSGEGEATPVVLLHSGNTTSAAWYRNVADLAKGRPVYAVDIMGEPGRSVQMAPLLKAKDCAEWLSAVLDGLDLKQVHLVGLSYGGWLAANQAVHAPDRLTSLTLIEPARVLAELNPVFAARTLVNMVVNSEALWREYQVWCDGAAFPEDLRNLQVATLLKYRKRTTPPRRLRDKHLAALTMPTLVLLGEESPIHNSRRAARRAEKLIPNAEVVLVPGGKHGLPAQLPEVITPSLHTFLATH